MLDPLSLLPLALAAHGGHVDEFEVQQLVAAGLTLLQRSAPLVRALAGRRSAILLPASPQFFVALAASDGRGAVLIDPLASPYEIAHQLADASVGAVFTTAALARALPDGLPRVLVDDAPRQAFVIAGGVSRGVDLGSHTGLSLRGDTGAPGSDEEAAIRYTSAMAGTPLGAILSHRNLLANARSTMHATANSGDDRVLALLPFTHLFGLTVSAAAPLLTGASVVTMPRFIPARAAELIATTRITEVVGVPSMFRALLAVLERREQSIAGVAALRMCVCVGASLASELQDRWFDVTGTELRQAYGLSEAAPLCLFNRADRPNVRATLGWPVPEVDVELRNEEIIVRGDNIFRGYLSRNEDGLAVHDGWLHTGDRGRQNVDGTISFGGAIKQMFEHDGFNIYPREIEQAVEELDGVDSARVSQAPSSLDDDGRDAGILLEVRGTAEDAAIRQWCAVRLSPHKQPTVITIR